MNEKVCFYWPPYPKIKSYFDMIDVAEKYRMSAIEGFSIFEFQNPDIEQAKKIREYADRKNIKFSCFSVYINLVGDDSGEMLERLKGYAHVAAVLGSPYLHHTIANDFLHPEEIIPNREEFFKRGIDAVRQIYDYSKGLGVKTIYEEQGFVFNGTEWFGKFLEEGKRDVGVVADFANICQMEEDIVDFIKLYSDKIVHAHIKDVFYATEDVCGQGMKTINERFMNEAVVGEGSVRIKEAVELLKTSGYDGYYTIEFSCNDDNSPVIDKTLEFINSII